MYVLLPRIDESEPAACVAANARRRCCFRPDDSSLMVVRMPPIATIGAKVKVTPDDEIQVIHGPGGHEFIDDRTPFSIVVSGTVMNAEDELVGVFGEVISGHPRYQGQIA